eukprot:TRINITY_DN19558_c0_g1_i1.p1 TRINITY_DN19558_c0_g1~~TRINITY_DN19558_c0_g1_i1.p1  ORF type:complete len:620 (-),score=101.48 TRINITY_DN19558_c0_g1_i1:183-2042(-)
MNCAGQLLFLDHGEAQCAGMRFGTKETMAVPATEPEPQELPSDTVCTSEGKPHQDPEDTQSDPQPEIVYWFANKLLAERVSMTALLEQNHSAIIDDFHRLFGRFSCNQVSDKIETNQASIDGEASTIGCFAEPFPILEALETNCPNESQESCDGDKLRSSAHGDNTSVEDCPEPPPCLHSLSERGVLHVGSTENDVSRRVDEYVAIAASEVVNTSNSRLVTLESRIEMFMAFVIILNIIVMALERQYIGIEIGFASIGFSNYRAGHATWPWGKTLFSTAEIVFGILFIFEILAMLWILRARFFKSPWHLFDAAVVLCWLVTIASAASSSFINPMLLRMAKLMRLGRLMRIFRAAQFWDKLHLMVTACFASFAMVFWSVMLLVLVIMVAALCVSQTLQTYLEDVSMPLSSRTLVFEQWGTFSRALEIMFEVTLGNWGPPCRLLQNHVSDWWIVFFIAYKCIIGFSVVQVITSVFIQQTFKCLAQDEDRMLAEKQAQTDANLRKLLQVFKLIDVTGDGFLSPEELAICIKNATIQTWFAALEIDVAEASRLFSVIDDGDGMISAEEFLQSIKLCRSTAKSIDCQMVLKEVRRLARMTADPDCKSSTNGHGVGSKKAVHCIK